MLWSLIKIVLFIAIVAGLTLLAADLMQTDGGVVVSIANVEFTLGPLQLVIAAVLLILAVWIVLKILGILVALVRFLNGDETALSRYFDRNRERKGYEALADGMLALASGEGKEAMSKANKAERYLNRPELTNLIAAQAAELQGDKRKAEDVYKKLLAHDRTRFVGVRGLMKQKIAEGDTDTALKLAEKAFALKPRHAETQDILLQLQAGHADWAGARKTLGAKLKTGTLPRDVHKRRDAVLALSEAKGILDTGNTIEAKEAAIEANRLSPDLIPAAVLAARYYIQNNQEKYATRVIRKAWEVQPHPDLAAAFAEIRPDESPRERIKRFTALTRIKPDHPETRMLLAELNIADEDFPAARRALGDLATSDPTARSVTIMAAIERGEGADDAIVRGWLTRALSVSRGPQWVCDNCHTIHSAWMPVCDTCGAFDTLSWTVPKTGEVSMPTSTGMLPLIVGKIEPPKPSEPAQTVPAEPVDAEIVTPDPVPSPVPEETPEPVRETETRAPEEARPIPEDSQAPRP
ncbi:heme biosynthesis HemY N-terminal domain-containing protein [Oceaniglobus roseus]|uniref:heme biosynthesis HemY N-terminal domain-containing protein n=1 Tax=Oceaniglobus roseus TaxID=1737570 RepID=UPI000C7F74D2|nr:heme biosynthesis HemY N-terminal domain-containing protein [Kandeliimicrobium roseum]